MQTIDITPVLEAFIGLICAVITYVLVPFIRDKFSQHWVDRAVEWAEQTKIGSNLGKEKKAAVIEWLDSHHIKIDADKLELMIESAVYRLTNHEKETSKTK